MKQVIALARATASSVGTAASVAGKVAVSARKHLWPPVRRGTKKYILPTVAVLGRHTVPITMALAKSAYANANALSPHVGRVVKPAWRVARDRAVKPSWRLSRELVMKPLYNRAVLPTMKRGAQKVLQWNEWKPELEQQQQQQHQQNVDAYSSAAEEEEGHENLGRKATKNEPNIFDKLGDDEWARRPKD
uniref:Secreted protein n=1 Tax=Globodera pallida TaxID=36090 RepID=A0A183C7L9_GLOPA